MKRRNPMELREFALVPFAAPPAPASSAAGGSLARSGSRLALEMVITGVDADAAVATVTGAPRRRDHLWKRTCAELFIAAAGAPGYHELNLAPSGDWNLYRFDGYRAAGRPEDRVTSLSARIAVEDGRLRMAVELDLVPLGLNGVALEAGISAVLESTGGAVSHWALVHPAPVPDFHDRRAFTLRLPAPTSKGRR